MTLLRDSNIIQAAEDATGIAYRPGEDIVISKTSHPRNTCKNPSRMKNFFSSIHHDRNNAGNGGIRHATFMVYLTTIAPGHGGETFFPALNSNLKKDMIAQQLKSSYRDNRCILELDSSLSQSCEKRLVEWRQSVSGSSSSIDNHIDGFIDGSMKSSEDGSGSGSGSGSSGEGGGGGVHCEEGKAVVFDASCEYGSWHAGCSVYGGTEDKWIVTFFKAPPTRFSGMMMGL